jgi:hypothetical protein
MLSAEALPTALSPLVPPPEQEKLTEIDACQTAFEIVIVIVIVAILWIRKRIILTVLLESFQ